MCSSDARGGKCDGRVRDRRDVMQGEMLPAVTEAVKKTRVNFC